MSFNLRLSAGKLSFENAISHGWRGFIEPYVVGGEVNLSAMATIVIIVCGGLIWGIAGTILFIPLLGIIKIVCDHVEPLKPYGFLVGDPSGNKPSKIGSWISDFFKRNVARKKSK